MCVLIVIYLFIGTEVLFSLLLNTTQGKKGLFNKTNIFKKKAVRQAPGNVFGVLQGKIKTLLQKIPSN